MRKYAIEMGSDGGKIVKIGLKGKDLLASSLLNKGCSFSHEEREVFDLIGLLPFCEESLSQQVERHYQQYQSFSDNLEKNIYLNVLMSNNETLFYRLLSEHLEEMLPIIYTPTVGEAVEKFSLQFRRERGLYIDFPNQDHMRAMLGGKVNPDIDLLVITDGSAVLGIGDQGVGGMAISVGKMIVYALCAGVSPHRILPVQLDVGTDNPGLLASSGYLGWHEARVKGEAYDQFVDSFVTQAREIYPNALFHWEDFDRENASAILTRYQDQFCTFNDDMQGTGAVTLASVLAGLHRGELGSLEDQRYVIHGAGAAAIGIADQLVDAMVAEGVSEDQARGQFWLLNRKGLLTDESEGLSPMQQRYCQSAQALDHWSLPDSGVRDLLTVVTHVKPTVLIGCSTVAGAFDEAVVRAMAKTASHPIILPLSNPSSKSEALPQDLLDWTEGRALVATGSPFDDVVWQGQTIPIAQCNNAFVYPGLGFGLVVSKARRLTPGILISASKALAAYAQQDATTSRLLPPLSDFPEYAKKIALAVAEKAREDGVAGVPDDMDFSQEIEHQFWQPEYYPYEYDETFA
jgi:malate dehydrogenase (oxaloacetate-decarboxylating)